MLLVLNVFDRWYLSLDLHLNQIMLRLLFRKSVTSKFLCYHSRTYLSNLPQWSVNQTNKLIKILNVVPSSVHIFTRSLHNDISQKEQLNSSMFDANEININDTNNVTNNSAPLLDEMSTLADYGLCGSVYPHHLIQSLLDYMNTTLDISWIPAIAIVTIALRCLALPTYIKMRQFNTKMSNYLPETTELQFGMMQATNPIERNKKRLEYMEFLQKHNLNPIKPLLFSLPMSAIFLSFFAALRGISEAKVASFVNGGALWFKDLTVPDPYCILPMLACSSLYLLFRFGAAAAEVGPAESFPLFQKILLWSPMVFFPFAVFQPACMFIFWLTSNSFSMLLMYLFLNPKVLKLCGIPNKIKHSPSVKESMKLYSMPALMKKVREQEDLRQQALRKAQKHIDEMNKLNGQKKKDN